MLLAIGFSTPPFPQALMLSHVEKHVEVVAVSFICRLSARGIIGLVFSSFVLLACAFGLLLPSVKVRNANCLAD